MTFIILLFSTLSAFALTLKDGLELAIKNDTEVQLRENNLLQIKRDIEVATGLFLPTLDFRSDIGNSKTTNNSLTPDRSLPHQKSDEYELILTQPLYDGENAKFQEHIEKSRYESAIFYLKESENLVSLGFVENYLNVLKEKDTMTLQTESYQISEDIFHKISSKVQKGFGTRLEFEEAKANVEESNLNLTIQKLSYRQGIENLKKYLQKDIDPNELIKPIFNFQIPELESEALEFAMVNHPSMLVSLNNIDVALYEYKRDKKAFKPNVNLYGRYKVNDVLYKDKSFDESNEYKIGLEVAYNLYSGGKDAAKNKKSIEYINEKKVMIEKSKQQITNKLALAWNSYTINQEKLLRLKDFLETRKYILEGTIKEFDLGTRSLTDLFEAHRDYIATKRNLINTSYDFLLSQYRVLEAMGILSDNILNDKRVLLLQSKTSTIDKLLLDISEELKYSYDVKGSLPEFNTEVIVSNNDETSSTMYLEANDTISSDISFKEKFLTSDESKYTINLANAFSMEESIEYMKSFDILDNAFSFEFGEQKIVKIMYGIFDSYKEAKIALEGLDKKLLQNHPRVESIHIKQNLYKKYHEKN
jgi:outer membrane protein, adhesin transport system